MDGTIADFDGAMQAGLAALRSPHEPEPDLVDGWKEGLPWLAARRQLIKNQVGFWRNLPVIEDGMLTLRLIERLGFETHILTKGPYKTTSAWTEKVEWCRHYLPETPVTVTEDKGLVYGRVLFDDWPSYIQRWLEWRPRGLVLMLDQPWNQGFEHPNVFRVKQLQKAYRAREQEIKNADPTWLSDSMLADLHKQFEDQAWVLRSRLEQARDR